MDPREASLFEHRLLPVIAPIAAVTSGLRIHFIGVGEKADGLRLSAAFAIADQVAEQLAFNEADAR